ncbi:hypothetical protein WUBG_13960 [Wuchereria bancrofti]|uniref:Acyltransferase 3 domain-containing protein n=1 Tax=Wuchereria bancrofti TaxID=6293 RepID=J9DZ34_WUCBA|nr:hypothetical protein WUBG_13960 [Wuchereria bancrofti]
MVSGNRFFNFTFFAPILLIPLALKPMLGYIIAGLLLLLSTVANLVTVYMEYFPPTDFYMGVMDPRMGPYRRYSLLIYQAPWIRCQVYIIGILVGYLFQTVKTLHISKLTNIICWIVSLILGLLVIMSLRDWIGYDIVMDLSVRAFYSAFSKLVWSLSLAYITIACFYGYGGPINDFMSLSIWKPLGRLTYCTYLTHLIVLIYMLCIGVNASSFSSITHTFFVFSLPCCIISWFFAYWLSILFELPVTTTSDPTNTKGISSYLPTSATTKSFASATSTAATTSSETTTKTAASSTSSPTATATSSATYTTPT